MIGAKYLYLMVFLIDRKSKTNFVKPSIIYFFKPSSLFPNEANPLCTIELLLRDVSKQVVFENSLNLPIKSQPEKASTPNSASLFSFPNALYAHNNNNNNTNNNNNNNNNNGLLATSTLHSSLCSK